MNKNILSFACQGKFCRAVPGPGQGIIVVEQDGTKRRLCGACWDKRCVDLTLPPEPSPEVLPREIEEVQP